MWKIRGFWLVGMGLFALAACGDTAPESSAPAEGMGAAPAAAPSGPATVWFMEPEDGAEVVGPDVRVVLDVSGLRVVEAGVFDEGTGHHHIFVDQDVTPMGEVIPAGIPGIIHMGLAQTEYLVEGLDPGQHRLIAVVGGGAHIPLDPPVMDTVVFTVVAPPGQ